MDGEWTREEIYGAALVLVIQENGERKWTSTKTTEQVIAALRNIADQLENRPAALYG